MSYSFNNMRTRSFISFLSIAAVLLGCAGYPIKAYLAPPSVNAPYNTQPDGAYPVTDGVVKAIAHDYVNNIAYIGGDFHNAGKNSGSGAIFSDTDGSLNLNDTSKFRGKVNRAIKDGTGGMYIAGSFDRVGDFGAQKFVQLFSNNAIDQSFLPQPNGPVNSMLVTSDRIYIAGNFTQASGGAVTNIAQFDKNNNGFLSSFNPSFDAPINMIAEGTSTIYAVGNFQNAGGTGVKYFASIDPSTATVSQVNVNADGEIKTIMIDGLTAFVTGSFTNIGGQPRAGIAQIDLATGSSTSWNPNVTGTINAVAQDGGKVYVAGNLTAGGKQNVVAISKADASITSFTANTNGAVESISLDNGKLYIGGQFTEINGTKREYIARVDSTSGALDTSWLPMSSLPVYVVLADGNRIFVGAEDKAIFNPQKNRSLFAVDLTTKNVLPWNPEIDGIVESLLISDSRLYVGGNIAKVGNITRNNMAIFDLPSRTLSNINPNPNNVVNKFTSDDDYVYVSGNFTSFDGKNYSNLAAINKQTGSSTNWNPIVNGKVNDMFVASSSVYLFGEFTTTNGVPTSRTAVVPAANSNSTTTIELIDVDGPVYGAVIDHQAPYPNKIFMGGQFNTVGGQTRNNIAVYDLNLNSLSPYVGDTDGPVYSVSIFESDKFPVVFFGGRFSNFNGSGVYNSVTLNTRNFSRVPWTITTENNSNKIYSLITDYDIAIVGGDFNYATGLNSQFLAFYPSLAVTPNAPADPTSDTSISGVQAGTNFSMSAYYYDADVYGFGMTNYRVSNQGLSGCQNGTGVVFQATKKIHQISGTTTMNFYIPSDVDGTYNYCAQNFDGLSTSAWVSLGSFSYVAPAIVTPPPSNSTSTQSESNGSNSGSIVSGSFPIVIGTTTASTTVDNGLGKFKFNRNLMYGMTGFDVFMLQRYLNNTGFLLGLEGYGSYGLETYFFGNKTRAAVTKFQEAHPNEILKPQNLLKGTGIFHIYSRAFANSH